MFSRSVSAVLASVLFAALAWAPKSSAQSDPNAPLRQMMLAAVHAAPGDFASIREQQVLSSDESGQKFALTPDYVSICSYCVDNSDDNGVNHTYANNLVGIHSPSRWSVEMEVSPSFQLSAAESISYIQSQFLSYLSGFSPCTTDSPSSPCVAGPTGDGGAGTIQGDGSVEFTYASPDGIIVGIWYFPPGTGTPEFTRSNLSIDVEHDD